MIYARISVHIDLEVDVPNSIKLLSEFRNWVYEIQYENKSRLCSLCETTGHSASSCPRKHHEKDPTQTSEANSTKEVTKSKKAEIIDKT